MERQKYKCIDFGCECTTFFDTKNKSGVECLRRNKFVLLLRC